MNRSAIVKQLYLQFGTEKQHEIFYTYEQDRVAFDCALHFDKNYIIIIQLSNILAISFYSYWQFPKSCGWFGAVEILEDVTAMACYRNRL